MIKCNEERNEAQIWPKNSELAKDSFRFKSFNLKLRTVLKNSVIRR